MKRYMLDTNTVSNLIKNHSAVVAQIEIKPAESICISAITEGELRFGLSKRPEAKRLHQLVGEFLLGIEILPWDSSVAEYYGAVRADLTRKGRVLAPLDLLIATHAMAVHAVLVTNDKAFSQVANLRAEDWSKI